MLILETQNIHRIKEGSVVFCHFLATIDHVGP